MNDPVRGYLLRRSAKKAGKNQNWARAALIYEALRRTGAARPSDVVRHAHATEAAGRKDVAEQLHRNNICLFPLEPNVHRQSALFLLRHQKEPEAVLAFSRALVLAPANEVLKADLERLGVGEDRISAVAVAAFHAAPPPQPARPGKLAKFRARRAAKTAKALRQSGDWNSALAAQTKVLAHNPHNAFAQIRLGHVLKALNRLQEAETAYWKGVALAPQDAVGYLQLGHGLKIQRGLNGALPAYLMAQKLEPSLIEAGGAATESDLPEQDRARLADALASANVKAILTFKSDEDASESSAAPSRQSDEDASESSAAPSRRISATQRPTPMIINVRATAIAGDIARAVGANL